MIYEFIANCGVHVIFRNNNEFRSLGDVFTTCCSYFINNIRPDFIVMKICVLPFDFVH